jgi:hypothetical protein
MKIRSSLNFPAISFAVFTLLSTTPAEQAMAATDNSTLTVGSKYGGPGYPITFYGYGSGYGSLSPSTLTGGKTVSIWDDKETLGTLSISGFSSNPGQSWLTSAGCTGLTTKTGASASYTWNSSLGTATWAWTGAFGFATKNGTAVACTIKHT